MSAAIMMKIMEKNDIFKGFNSWFKTAKLRNPDTHLDEARLFVMVLFWGVTLYILGTGLYYHYEIFRVASSSGFFAVSISATIFVIGELGKYKLFTILAWGVFSGDFRRSYPKFAAYVLMLILVSGFYYWSWNISTNAAPTLNALINKTSNNGSVAGDSTAIRDLEAQLATVTGQMADATEKENSGLRIRYRGVVTQEGQAIARQNGKSKNKLIDQQGQIRQELAAARAKMDAYRTSQYDLAANQLSEYGGYGEFCQILLLLISTLILVEMYERNLRGKTTPTPTPSVNTASAVNTNISNTSAVNTVNTGISNTNPVNTGLVNTVNTEKYGKYKYLQGYIFVKMSDRYYNPSDFIVWIRNSHTRGNTKIVEELRQDLLVYFEGEYIDPKILAFIGKYPDVVGEAVNTVYTEFVKEKVPDLIELDAQTKLYVLHEAGHFVAHCIGAKGGYFDFAPDELYANVKEGKGFFSCNLSAIKTCEAVHWVVVQYLAGLAVEYTNTFEHTESNFFENRVVAFEKTKGSDTEMAMRTIKQAKKVFNQNIDLEAAFYDAVNLMIEYKEGVYAVAGILAKKGCLNAKELTQIAHDLKLIA